jgi:siroheme synthase
MVNANYSRVVFVGAGPGAADLITVRGLKLLQSADTVIHDSLPGDALLAEVRPSARLVAVGKRCGQHSMTQDEINAFPASSDASAKRWIISRRWAFLSKWFRA